MVTKLSKGKCGIAVCLGLGMAFHSKFALPGLGGQLSSLIRSHVPGHIAHPLPRTHPLGISCHSRCSQPPGTGPGEVCVQALAWCHLADKIPIPWQPFGQPPWDAASPTREGGLSSHFLAVPHIYSSEHGFSALALPPSGARQFLIVRHCRRFLSIPGLFCYYEPVDTPLHTHTLMTIKMSPT